MRAYTIKRKGVATLGNMLFGQSITYNNGNKIYCDLLFYRKKDAQRYLKTFAFSDLFEVVGLTFDNNKNTKN